MSEKNPYPSFRNGLLAFIREPYYTVAKSRRVCPNGHGTWAGWYAYHMDYCHFCGVELEERESLISEVKS